MKTNLVFLLVAAFAATAWSEPVASTNAGKKVSHRMSRFDQINRKGYKVHGGALYEPSSKRGRVIFVNQQTKVGESNLVGVVGLITKNLPINLSVVKAEKGDVLPDVLKANKANFGIAVIDDPVSPAMLVAPEDHWASVNVAKLTAGENGKTVSEPFLEARVRKELLRAFAYLCGATSSQFNGNLMDVTDVGKLDSYGEFLPMDIVRRAQKHLDNAGVTPERITTYRSACEEGWAPKPTNDVQKAIWDMIHAKTTKPLKVKFDPKKGE